MRRLAPAPSEYQAMAACLYNLARYVEWPAGAFGGADAPFVLGVLGQDPFGRLLDDLVKNRSVSGRPVVIRRFGRVEDVRGCHLLFVSRSENARLAQILGGLGKTSVLTVSETQQFLQRGGMIRFVLESGKIRLAINPDAAARAGLKIRSSLLGLPGIRIERH